MKPILRTIAVVAALALGACKSWQPQPLVAHPPQRLTGDARVTRTDNSEIVLRAPVVAGDSLTGTSGIDQRVSIPLSDIRTVRTRRTDASLTFLAVAAAAAAALIIRSATNERVVY